MAKVQRAILSCFDKQGLEPLARLLEALNVQIISTSGTLDSLRAAGLQATPLREYTGVPELFEGRLKSLHPKVHAGILGVRDNKLHADQMVSQGFEWIDLVVVNVRPLDALTARSEATTDEVMDQIDMGGLAMLRAAAKNFRYVTCIVNPQRYATVMHELRANDGEVSFATRYRLAREAFSLTATYDQAIADYLARTEPPET